MSLTKIVKGILTQPYMGYSVGATIFYVDVVGCNFAILCDIDDENYGISMDSHKKPLMEDYKFIEETEVQESKFFTIYGLIQKKVVIPISVDLCFTYKT
jgi:hypothetical protein